MEDKSDKSKHWFQLGFEYYKDGKFNDAIECFKHSLDFDPNHIYSLKLLGEIYYELNYFQKAIDIFKIATKVDPKDSFNWYELALFYYKNDNLDEAIKACHISLELFPHSDIWNFLGELYVDKALKSDKADIATELMDNAIESFEIALDYENENVDYLFNLAQAFYFIGDNLKAKDVFRMVTEKNPEIYEVWVYLGNIYNTEEAYEKAMTSFQNAISLDDSDDTVWRSLGNSCRYMGQYDKAVKFYKRSIKLNKENVATWYQLGMIYNLKGDYYGAIKALSQSINIQPGFLSSWYNIAKIYLKIKNYKVALDICHSVLGVNPELKNFIKLKKAILKFRDKDKEYLLYKRVKEIKERFLRLEQVNENLTNVDLMQQYQTALEKENYSKKIRSLTPKSKKFFNETKKNQARIYLDNFENNVRSFIKNQLKNGYGNNWWELGIPEPIKSKVQNMILNKKKLEPRRSYKNISFLSFNDYYLIISYKKNWNKIFSVAFYHKKYMVQTYFEKITSIRNDLSHGRYFEEDVIKLKISIEEILKFISNQF